MTNNPPSARTDPAGARARLAAVAGADVAALEAESERLFAEHHALAQANQRRAAQRDQEMQNARARQVAAHAAHEAAASAWEAAIEARRADPGNLTLVAQLDQAEAVYRDGCAEAERVNREVQAAFSRMFDESHADTEALLALGQRARAAQDAWFLATTPTPPSTSTDGNVG